MATPNGPYLCYALAARKNARHLSRLYDRWLAPAELSVSQFSILALVDAHGQLKITELADMLSMERTTLVRALKPLQTAGWVVAERPDMVVDLSTSGCQDAVVEDLPRRCRSGKARRRPSNARSAATGRYSYAMRF